jgi:DNA replication and repair protein RecF
MGLLPIVFIAPDDAKIVKEGSLERRDFMNRILCQIDPDYLRTLINYRSLLKQKEAILKNDRNPDTTVLDSFNSRMAPLADIIFAKRREFVTTLADKTIKNYKTISQADEQVNIVYDSQLLNDNITNLLRVRQYDEIMVRRTIVGTHKDDLIFTIDERPIKKYGSQGQIKSFLYALRLAEFDILKMALNKLPILMFDDYFEKLDGLRLNSLLAIIAEQSYGQIFLSDTELDRSKRIFDDIGITFHSLLVGEKM